MFFTTTILLISIVISIYRPIASYKIVVNHSHFHFRLPKSMLESKVSKSFKEAFLIAKLFTSLRYPGVSPKGSYYTSIISHGLFYQNLFYRNHFTATLIYFWSVGVCVKSTHKVHDLVMGHFVLGRRQICTKVKKFSSIYFVKRFSKLLEHAKEGVIVLTKRIKETTEEERSNDYVKAVRIVHDEDALENQDRETRIERVIVFGIKEINFHNGILEYHLFTINYKNQIDKFVITVDGNLDNVISMDKKWDKEYILIC